MESLFQLALGSVPILCSSYFCLFVDYFTSKKTTLLFKEKLLAPSSLPFNDTTLDTSAYRVKEEHTERKKKRGAALAIAISVVVVGDVVVVAATADGEKEEEKKKKQLYKDKKDDNDSRSSSKNQLLFLCALSLTCKLQTRDIAPKIYAALSN